MGIIGAIFSLTGTDATFCNHVTMILLFIKQYEIYVLEFTPTIMIGLRCRVD